MTRMTAAVEGLTLYHLESCMYCKRVRRATAALGVEVELRDIERDPQARAALLEAMGRTTVPVLHIEGERWLPESADIVRYLYDRFGQGRRPPLSVALDPRWIVLALVVLVLGFLLVR